MSTRSAAVRAAGDSAPGDARRRRRPAGSPRRRSRRRRSSPAWPRPGAARPPATPSAPGRAGRTRPPSRTSSARSASDARASCGAGDHPVGVRDAGLRRDRAGRLRVVAGGDEHPDAGGAQLLDGGDRRRPAACRPGRPARAASGPGPRRRGRRAGRPRPGRRRRAPAAPPPPAPAPAPGTPGASAQRRSTTSGAPFTTSRPSRSAAENPRSAAKGRHASGSPSAATPRSAAASATARSVSCAWSSPSADGRGGEPQHVVLARARRRPSGTSRTTRSRFSVSVPVLSKQTVSTRPSASSTRALRTTAPRRDSRRAAACWATVATSGSPSGTAATATASPEPTASRSGRPHSTPSAVTDAAAGEGQRQHRPGQLAEPGLDAGGRRGATGRPAPRGRPGSPSPTATTTARPRPATTVVPSKSMQVRSATSAPGVAGDRLAHRQRLAGQVGLVDLEVGRLQQPGVGGHARRRPRRARRRRPAARCRARPRGRRRSRGGR